MKNITTQITPTEIKKMVESGELKKLHTATKSGYVSRKTAEHATEYKGKFGTGFIIATPRFDTTRYHNITYYVYARP